MALSISPTLRTSRGTGTWGAGWPTLFFFIGLFIVVGAVVDAGIVGAVAQRVLDLTQRNAARRVPRPLDERGRVGERDNIPHTITMIPLVQELGRSIPSDALVWALALGANFGGNATIVGASANVVVASMSETKGHPLTFAHYLRYGVPATLLTMAVASVDVWVRYIAFR